MNIGILGLGTVGGGVVNVLNKNQTEIYRRSGVNIQIKCVAVKNITQKRICPTDNLKLIQDPFAVVNAIDVDVVLELIGGTGLAKTLVETAIKSGKHVVTANKALIATHGNELLALAKKHQVYLLFEAAVAGGIPILKSLEQGLSANKVEMVAGIINSTGNFILSEMRDKGKDFDDILKEAQALGYAETDPTFDIEGIDAAHKLAILTSIAFGSKLQFDKVSTQGISKIEGEDIVFATELGYTIKHLGIAKQIDGKIQMRVHPTLIPKTRLLANVNGVMNAILIKGNAAGQTLYYGAGAGDEATASSVIADLINIIKGTVSDNVLGWQSLKTATYQDNDNIESIFYLRLLVTDKPGVLADITTTLAKHNISVEQVLQKPADAQNNAHLAIITNMVKTAALDKAIVEIQTHDFIQQDVKIIYVETLN